MNSKDHSGWQDVAVVFFMLLFILLLVIFSTSCAQAQGNTKSIIVQMPRCVDTLTLQKNHDTRGPNMLKNRYGSDTTIVLKEHDMGLLSHEGMRAGRGDELGRLTLIRVIQETYRCKYCGEEVKGKPRKERLGSVFVVYDKKANTE